MTPGGGVTPGSARDKLGLNTPSHMGDGGMTPAMLDEEQQEQMANLRSGLAGLPTPKNDFEIVLPEELPDGTHEEELGGERADGYVADMGDEEEKYRQEMERQRQEQLNKRHTALKKELVTKP